MAWLIVWLCLTTFGFWTFAATETKEKFDPPQDKLNCPISALSLSPWLVAVWDNDDKIVVGHGSMLTYIIFLTTCRQYTKEASHYEAHAQFIWDLDKPFDPCTQSQSIESITKHPNCTSTMLRWSIYDFAVFKLKSPFKILGTTYPTLSISNNENELFDGAKYLNVDHKASSAECYLLTFRNQDERIPVFNILSPFILKVIPFRDQCMNILCGGQRPSCGNQFKEYDLDTFLCMQNKSGSAIDLGNRNEYWMAGAPLFCDSRVYGLASRPVLRGESSTTTDFHFILPMYHIWQWAVELMVKNSLATEEEVYDKNKYPFKIPTEKPIVQEDDDVGPFIAANAVSLVPLTVEPIAWIVASLLK